MQLATITALFAASALAAPISRAVSSETIAITNFSVRRTVENKLNNVNFNIDGGDAANLTCSLDNPELPYSAITKCGDSNYSFALIKGTETDYGVRLYKTLGPAVGLYGESDIVTYCHAGGLGDLLCNQQFPAEVVIDSA